MSHRRTPRHAPIKLDTGLFRFGASAAIAAVVVAVFGVAMTESGMLMLGRAVAFLEFYAGAFALIMFTATVGLGLLTTGLHQQINLILLVAGLAAGPVVASIFVSAAMLRGLRLHRRVPPYVFAGDRLAVDYTLENTRSWTAALALFVDDDLVPVDRAVSGSHTPAPRAFFARVPGRERARVRWQGPSPGRGRYRLRSPRRASRRLRRPGRG